VGVTYILVSNLLSGIVALILLVVCVNLASLTLARATARRQEISTRIALGATPWRAIRQFVVESLFLSTMGALSGMLLAVWASKLLVRLLTGLCLSALFRHGSSRGNILPQACVRINATNS
jgi:ABC-type antimicrobial peptide transport system permease subunit